MRQSRTDLRKRFSYRPRFEALEQRAVPTATAVFNGGTITITGDKKSDSVVINDDGNAGLNGHVTVLVNGQQVLQADATQVNAIQFNMGGGNDSVVYNLTKVLSGGSPAPARAISGSLGKGNDSFTANVQDQLSSGQLSFNVLGNSGKDALTLNVLSDLFGTARLDCTFDGGKDRDTLTVNAVSGPPFGTPGVDVQSSAQMNVNLLGGKDKDSLSMNYTGDLDGKLTFVGDGGKDNDTVSAAFNLDPGSGFGVNPGDPGNPNGVPLMAPATLDAKVLGGSGKDKLSLAITRANNGGNLTVTDLLDGGPQKDTCTTGGNVPVTVVNCP